MPQMLVARYPLDLSYLRLPDSFENKKKTGKRGFVDAMIVARSSTKAEKHQKLHIIPLAVTRPKTIIKLYCIERKTEIKILLELLSVCLFALAMFTFGGTEALIYC